MKIEAKPGKADKMHIHIDGDYAFTVDAAFWYRCGWAYESEIDAASLAGGVRLSAPAAGTTVYEFVP